MIPTELQLSNNEYAYRYGYPSRNRSGWKYTFRWGPILVSPGRPVTMVRSIPGGLEEIFIPDDPAKVRKAAQDGWPVRWSIWSK